MKRSWFPIMLVAGLLSLLSVLAFLQYRWLGQISDGERERMARSLQTETARFAEDFNREIQNAYFNFQLNGDVWRAKNWNDFNARYEFWRTRTAYPNLIKSFYFVELGGEQNVSQFNSQTKAFETANLPENLEKSKPLLAAETNFEPIAAEIPALLMPVHEPREKINQILISADRQSGENVPRVPINLPKKYGVLIIELNADVIKNELFPDLAKKYFSESDAANYRLAVVDRKGEAVFQNENLTATDASAALFELSSDNFLFFANREALAKIAGERKTMYFSSSRNENELNGAEIRRGELRVANNEKRLPLRQSESTLPQPIERRFEMQVLRQDSDGQSRLKVFEGNSNGGIWTLNVQHAAGSLEQFITGARRKNLAVSFGILFLLGISVVLIFISAQRAKLFAQRQIDFVSSVSHEFRTPLAVIYSAGENLADGVAKEETQVSRYGNLIKGEGKKLAAMVEQILDFAGANSGRKKYDWREQNVAEIIDNALAECEPLLEEKGFAVEKEIADNLPPIVADKMALSRALQNLIGNSVKYSDGAKYLKITARNGGGQVKIIVEDQGLGIAKKDLPHIFEPFYRASSVVDQQIHGNGLGLSLVKKTVEAHKGEIKVESAAGAGSKFTVHLPARNQRSTGESRDVK